MSDRQIVEYLRSRGRVEPPDGLVRSVTAALDDATPSRSWFAPFVPAFAVAAAVGAVIVIALLLGQSPSIGPDPDASPTETAGTTASIEELEAALAEATAVLRRAPAVEGWQEARIRGEQASVTWFDWRSNGDAVVVQRVDTDVMQTAWWMDPDGQPPATERNVSTQIWVVTGSQLYRGTDEWRASAREEAPAALEIGTGILDGEIEPSQPLGGLVDASDRADVRVTHLEHADGGSTWTLETPYRDGTAYGIWTIAGGGDLRSWTWEVVGASPDLDAGPSGNFTTASLKFLPREEADPIRPPDIEAPPDPDDFGVPADLPLGARPEADIDYRAYVEDVLEFLEAYHWDGARVDWATARAAALDGLPDEPAADQAHARIRSAVETFDPFRTVFVRPRDVPPDGMGGDGSEPVLPSSERLGEIGYVALPAPGAYGTDALVGYLEAARTAMAEVETSRTACGWIVDLRDYDGGAWGPAMLAIGGLIDEGRAVSFRSPAGEWWLEADDQGLFQSQGFDWADGPLQSPYIQLGDVSDEDASNALFELPPYLPEVSGPPLAILVGNGTASGGEQTVVAMLGRPDTRSFGAPTAGMPIVAPNVPLADGAVLRVPIWVPVDRNGTAHTGNISPDEVIGDTRMVGSDATRDAAVDWLEDQAGCS